MAPFPCTFQKVNPETMQMVGLQGLGGAEDGDQMLNGYGVFLGGDGNVLELDRRGSCITS